MGLLSSDASPPRQFCRDLCCERHAFVVGRVRVQHCPCLGVIYEHPREEGGSVSLACSVNISSFMFLQIQFLQFRLSQEGTWSI